MLLRNDGGNQKNWIAIKLIGTRSNRDGIGAKVKLTAGGITQIAEVKSGSSYASGSDLRLLFGLADTKRADSIEIIWQSGIEQKIEDTSVNQTMIISESE